jgi:hypothetical protein
MRGSDSGCPRTKIVAVFRMKNYVYRHAFVAFFVTIWLVYFALLATLGVSSGYPELGRAILYEFLFISLVVSPPALLPLPPLRVRPSNSRYLLIVTGLGLIISAVAIFCLSVDKADLGIDYSKGICVARAQMTQIGQFRTGVRSPYSFIGNLLGIGFFVSVSIVLTQEVSRRVFWITILVSFTFLMIFSGVAASRSPIMLFGAFAAGMVCARFAANKPFPTIRMLDVCGCVAVTAIAALFVLSMFECRASASNMSDSQYRDSFVEYLGAKKNPQSSVDQPTTKLEIIADKARGLLGLTALYFTHSAFTFAAILSLPPDGSRILFVYPIQLLSKLRMVGAPDEEWALSGRFPSLPGGLWHDLGFAGMCLGAAIVGLAAWGALCAIRMFPNSVTAIGMSSAVFALAFLSPIHLIGEFAHFPFICFCFFAIPTLGYLAANVKAVGVCCLRNRFSR